MEDDLRRIGSESDFLSLGFFQHDVNGQGSPRNSPPSQISRSVPFIPYFLTRVEARFSSRRDGDVLVGSDRIELARRAGHRSIEGASAPSSLEKRAARHRGGRAASVKSPTSAPRSETPPRAESFARFERRNGSSNRLRRSTSARFRASASTRGSFAPRPSLPVCRFPFVGSPIVFFEPSIESPADGAPFAKRKGARAHP